MPGPICTWERDYQVDDGTSCRMPSQTPGPTTRKSPSTWLRGEALFDAYERSQILAPAAVFKKTGYALGDLLKGLLPGLLQTLLVLAAGTVLGSIAGGVIGFFFGGAGAAPGAVVGAEHGLEIGTAVLSWLGLAFLAAAIVQGFGELWAELSAGVKRAWAAPEFPDKDYPHEVEKVAQELANAAGTLFLLVLQAIVAWVFKRVAMESTRAAINTSQSIKAVGSEAAAADTVAAVVEKLRASKLGSGFADWVEQNWERLRDDPRLRPKARPLPDSGPGRLPTNPNSRGVFFFGEDVKPYLDRPNATLGRAGEPHFFMPEEDAVGIRNASDAARATGMAPSVARAYTSGGEVYGVSFPTDGLDIRQPTAADANGWSHFLEGGHTAVRTADPNGGFLVNETREFVTPGGGPMPPGSVLFQLGPEGAWIPIRSF